MKLHNYSDAFEAENLVKEIIDAGDVISIFILLKVIAMDLEKLSGRIHAVDPRQKLINMMIVDLKDLESKGMSLLS
jgi:hypothetical protein